MRIIGIDPGLANTGWGVIDADGARLRMLDYGVIVTSSALPTAERLRIIADAVQQRLEQFSPDTAAPLRSHSRLASSFPKRRVKTFLWKS